MFIKIKLDSSNKDYNGSILIKFENKLYLSPETAPYWQMVTIKTRVARNKRQS